MKTTSQKSSGRPGGTCWCRLAAAAAAEAEVPSPVKKGTDADEEEDEDDGGIECGRRESAIGAGETSGAGWGEDFELTGECKSGYWWAMSA